MITAPGTFSRRQMLLGATAAATLAACGSGGSPGASGPTFTISAIPDQDPEKLARLHQPLAQLIGTAISAPAAYQPVTEYPAVVRAFEVGDVHLAWMGGLTGVQARSRVPGALAIAQRDIDADFHSLFIAHDSSTLQPFTSDADLLSLAGHTFTFGSETSTSGRLMPQYFMAQAGLELAQLRGAPGFSGSHDATIEAVAAGSFEAGAVNEQVWKQSVEDGAVDLSKVTVVWRTPGYADYHWLARPDLDATFGAGTTARVTAAITGLSGTRPADATILDLFGATSFIPTRNENYDRIAEVAKGLGLLT